MHTSTDWLLIVTSRKYSHFDIRIRIAIRIHWSKARTPNDAHDELFLESIIGQAEQNSTSFDLIIIFWFNLQQKRYIISNMCFMKQNKIMLSKISQKNICFPSAREIGLKFYKYRYSNQYICWLTCISYIGVFPCCWQKEYQSSEADISPPMYLCSNQGSFL